MEFQTITLSGLEYVVVPRTDYDKLAGKASGKLKLPPFPKADAAGNTPAIAYARASIARTIINRMNAVGVQQASLSRQAGIPAATLNRILKCTRTPDESTVDKIDRALNKLEKAQLKSAAR